MFATAYAKLMDEQRRHAAGMRLEQLKKHSAGEKKLLETVVWPVLKSFEGVILEHEIISLTGVKIYIDAFYEPLGFAFESDGFGCAWRQHYP